MSARLTVQAQVLPPGKQSVTLPLDVRPVLAAEAFVLTAPDLIDSIIEDLRLCQEKFKDYQLTAWSAQPASPKELRLSKSGSNSSTRTGYVAAPNTYLRKHPLVHALRSKQKSLDSDEFAA